MYTVYQIIGAIAIAVVYFVIFRACYMNSKGEISVITDSSNKVVEVTGPGIYFRPRGVIHLMHEKTLYSGRIVTNITKESYYVYASISVGYEIDYSKNNPKILELFKKYDNKVYHNHGLFFEPAREKLRLAVSKYKTLEEASNKLDEIKEEIHSFLVEEGKMYNISIKNFRLTIK
jgi:hypothetical protein